MDKNTIKGVIAGATAGTIAIIGGAALTDNHENDLSVNEWRDVYVEMLDQTIKKNGGLSVRVDGDVKEVVNETLRNASPVGLKVNGKALSNAEALEYKEQLTEKVSNQ